MPMPLHLIHVHTHTQTNTRIWSSVFHSLSVFMWECYFYLLFLSGCFYAFNQRNCMGDFAFWFMKISHLALPQWNKKKTNKQTNNKWTSMTLKLSVCVFLCTIGKTGTVIFISQQMVFFSFWFFFAFSFFSLLKTLKSKTKQNNNFTHFFFGFSKLATLKSRFKLPNLLYLFIFVKIWSCVLFLCISLYLLFFSSWLVCSLARSFAPSLFQLE